VFNFDATTGAFDYVNKFVDNIPDRAVTADEAFLPPIENCQCSAYSDGGLGSWKTGTESAASSLAESLFGGERASLVAE